MRSIAIVLGTIAAAATASAFAQVPYYRDYRADPAYVPPPASAYYYDRRDDDRYDRDDRWRDRDYARNRSYECWNPRAGHFEDVREGERQNDLDFSRCRSEGGGYIGPYPGYRWR